MVNFTTYSSWGDSRLYALGVVALMLLAVLAAARFRRGDGARVGGLVNGLDNRWSTSKVSVLLWTGAILWAFLTVLFRYWATAVPADVPAEYFALLGIPAAGALGAKAVTSNAKGTKEPLDDPTLHPVKGIGQIFSDDSGVPDLLDSQYFLFNCVLLGYFIAGFFQIADPTSGTNVALPALPASLLALSGVSAATYLGKKSLVAGPAKPAPPTPPAAVADAVRDADGAPHKAAL
jgi:hypothetical protein